MLLQWIFSIGAVSILALILGFYVAAHYGGSKKKTILVFEVVSNAVLALLLFLRGGLTMAVVQGMLMLFILLVASHSDIRTREAEDYLSVMLLLVAFIGRLPADIPGMLLSAILTALPAFSIAASSKGQAIGGADIKLIAGCGAILGLQRSYAGLVLGMSLAIIVQAIRQKDKKDQGFALVPYLTTGFAVAQFLSWR